MSDEGREMDKVGKAIAATDNGSDQVELLVYCNVSSHLCNVVQIIDPFTLHSCAT